MMKIVMPWDALFSLIKPFCPKSEGSGRPAKTLLRMTELYLL